MATKKAQFDMRAGIESIIELSERIKELESETEELESALEAIRTKIEKKPVAFLETIGEMLNTGELEEESIYTTYLFSYILDAIHKCTGGVFLVVIN